MARIVLLLALAAGCAGEGQPRRAHPTRRTFEPARPVRWNATALERLGFAPAAEPAAEADGPALWTPPGWTRRAPGRMQLATFDVPGGASCSYSELPGAAGGLRANVDRWRRQQGLGPIDDGELAGLASARLGERDAALVEIAGEPNGLLGLIAIDPAGSSFLKLEGPSAALAAARDAFLELGRRLGEGDTGGGQAAHEGAHAPDADRAQAGDLVFDVPAGWRRGPDRSMRLATFLGDGWECSVTILGGSGGGLAGNVGRWYGQLGLAAPSSDELAALETIPVLGGDATLVAATGTYRGMLGETIESAGLLGAIRIGADRSLFVKVIGRSAAVSALRPAFEDFCRSITEAR